MNLFDRKAPKAAETRPNFRNSSRNVKNIKNNVYFWPKNLKSYRISPECHKMSKFCQEMSANIKFKIKKLSSEKQKRPKIAESFPK